MIIKYKALSPMFYSALSTMFYSVLSTQHLFLALSTFLHLVFALSTPHSILKWVDKTKAKLAAIDATAWTEEEKTAFATALEELQETILALLKTKTVIPT